MVDAIGCTSDWGSADMKRSCAISLPAPDLSEAGQTDHCLYPAFDRKCSLWGRLIASITPVPPGLIARGELIRQTAPGDRDESTID